MEPGDAYAVPGEVPVFLLEMAEDLGVEDEEGASTPQAQGPVLTHPRGKITRGMTGPS